MTKSNILRGLLLASTAAVMLVALGGRPVAAQSGQTGGSNTGWRLGNRGGGTPVQVVVKFNGNPVSGVTVTFKATNTATAVTDDTGSVSIALKPGTYKVSASNASGTATKTIKVVESTDTTMVGLVLVPATP